MPVVHYTTVFGYGHNGAKLISPLFRLGVVRIVKNVTAWSSWWMLEVDLYKALGAPDSRLGSDRRPCLKRRTLLQVYAVVVVVVHRC
jgi:hypothetical protein